MTDSERRTDEAIRGLVSTLPKDEVESGNKLAGALLDDIRGRLKTCDIGGVTSNLMDIGNFLNAVNRASTEHITSLIAPPYEKGEGLDALSGHYSRATGSIEDEVTEALVYHCQCKIRV